MARLNKQISLGYNAEGKRIRKWIHADSEQELKRKMREVFQSSDMELLSNKTFGKYKKEWLEAYHGNKSPATVHQYEYCLRQLSDLDGKRLKDITRTDVQKIINTFADRPTAALRISNTAKQIMNAAAADNLTPPRLWKFTLPKNKKSEKRALTEAEKKAIKAADLAPQERLFVDIEYYLGLRPGEARALQPKDFDLKNRTVSITKSVALSADNPILKGTKTGVSRTIPVPDVLLAEIRAYNAHFRGLYYFVDEEGNLFNRCRFNAFRERIFRKINEELGGNKNIDALNGMNFYTFRHNRATELYYLQGVSTKKKAEYMGHSELMFIKTYSHLDDSREAEELLRAVTNL